MELVAVLASLAVVTLLLVGSLAGIAALILVLRVRQSVRPAGGDPLHEPDGEIARRLAALERRFALAPDEQSPAAARGLPLAGERAAGRPDAPEPQAPPLPPPPQAPAPPPPPMDVGTAAGVPVISGSAPPLATAPPGAIAIDWERWIGVRGAAVAGGVVLALAALLLFQYTIEHNLITPPMRVGVGVATGLLCIALSEWLTRRVQPFAANSLTGAGIVALYASFWAGHSLYGLILDGGLIWLARELGWPLLAFLSVAGTALHEAMWVFTNTEGEPLLIGAVVAGVFALAFVGAASGPTGAPWRWTTVGGIAVAFGLALALATRAEPGSRIAPLGVLLILLAALACWLARRLDDAMIAVGAAAATLGILTVWLAVQRPSPGALWEMIGCSLAAAAVFHLGWELEREAGVARLSQAALLAAGGLLLLLIATSWYRPETPLWPWLAGWCGAAALLIRQSGLPGRHRLQVAGWSGLALALVGFVASSAGSPTAPASLRLLVIGILLALAARLATALWSSPANRRAAETSAAAAAAILLILPMVRAAEDAWSALPGLAFGLLLGLLVAVAAARLGSGAWLAVAIAAAALVHTLWATRWADVDGSPRLAGLALQLGAVVAFTLWPLRARPAFGERPGAWRAAALAGPAWFLAVKMLYEAAFPDAPIGLVPIMFAAVALVAASLVRRSQRESEETRATALAWYLAVAVGFVSIAIPLQLEREWVTIGWALYGLALIALWRRLDRPGLKYFGFSLLAAATLRLVANPAVLSYAERGAWPVLNWVLYTYLVPAGALLSARALLAPAELPRLRRWEVGLQGSQPVLAHACGISAVAVVFVWINLAIADLFSTSPMLALSFERMPARDLTTSIAWTLYGLCLLVLGIRGDSLTLRWLSLLLFLATIAKVFLHDLGELRDLYRVASLTGLAVSLIVVSIVYQRYVLRRSAPLPPVDP